MNDSLVTWMGMHVSRFAFFSVTEDRERFITSEFSISSFRLPRFPLRWAGSGTREALRRRVRELLQDEREFWWLEWVELGGLDWPGLELGLLKLFRVEFVIQRQPVFR